MPIQMFDLPIFQYLGMAVSCSVAGVWKWLLNH